MILKNPYENAGPGYLDLPDFIDPPIPPQDKYLIRRLGDIPAYYDKKTGATVLVQIGDTVAPGMRTHRPDKPLKRGERGIILAPLVRLRNGKVEPRRVHPLELRSAVMLWDSIDVPSNNMLPVDLTPDLQFLADEGFLRQTHLEASGFHVPQHIICHTHVAALSAAEEAEPGKWSLGRVDNTPHLARGILEEQCGILVRLFDAIPIPDKAAPLEEILRFKARRQAELKALQYHLERIYEHIANAPDRGRAEDRELAALDKSIVDYMRSLNETGFRKVLSRIDASIDLPQVATAAGSAVAAFAQGLPLAQAMMTAGAALSVSVGLGRRERSTRSSPFEYVACYRNELF